MENDNATVLKFIGSYQNYIVTEKVLYVIVKVSEDVGNVMNNLFQYVVRNRITISGEESDGTITYWSGTRHSLQLKFGIKRTIGMDTTISNLVGKDVSIELREGEEFLETEQANPSFVALIHGKMEKLAKIMYLRPKEVNDGLMAFFGRNIDWQVATEAEAQEFYACMHLYAYSNGMDIGAPDRDIMDMYKQIARKRNQCIICRSGIYKTIGTLPLCSVHAKEHEKIGEEKFNEKYFL